MKTRTTMLLLTLWFVLVVGLLAAPVAAGAPDADPNPWRPLNGPPGGSVGYLSLSPDFLEDHTLYAAANGSGVYRSTDAGLNWSAIGAQYFCGA